MKRLGRVVVALIILVVPSMGVMAQQGISKRERLPGRGLSSLPVEARSGILAALGRERSPEASELELAELTASDGVAGDELGYSVAVDGGTVVVGAPYENYNRGAVYVFVKPSGGWANATQAAKLTSSNTISAYLGWSVAISGNTIVAGAPKQSGTGGVYVYVKPETGWVDMTETAGLSISLNEGKRGVGCSPFGGYPFGGCELGWSVATNGETIVAGAPLTQGFVGANVFNKPSTGWKNRIGDDCRLSASDGGPMGYSVALDGTTAVVGAPEWSRDSKGYQGAAYVYANVTAGCIDGGMSETSRLLASDGQESDMLGFSVSISGNTIVAGAPQPHNSGSGAVYVYTKTDADWTSRFQIAKLTASDGVAGNQLGASVSIQGGIVAAGAPAWSDGSNQGAVYLYTEPAGGWQNGTETSELTAADGAPSDVFGLSVAVSGNTTAIGASGVASGSDQGAAYIFGP